MLSPSSRLARFVTPEVLTFLGVGGAGYVVDVVAFNILRSWPEVGPHHLVLARVLAVAVAMLVTYLGNRSLTWRGRSRSSRRREVSLFIFFNLIGLGLSVLALVISHDLLGLTSRLADNISANVIGVGLGTLFRFWSYRSFVFTGPNKRHRRLPLPQPTHTVCTPVPASWAECPRSGSSHRPPARLTSSKTTTRRNR